MADTVYGSSHKHKSPMRNRVALGSNPSLPSTLQEFYRPKSEARIGDTVIEALVTSSHRKARSGCCKRDHASDHRAAIRSCLLSVAPESSWLLCDLCMGHGGGVLKRDHPPRLCH